jgi:hypothetical protein
MTGLRSTFLPILLVATAGIAFAQNAAPSREDRPSPTPPSQLGFSVLQGNWIRPDGGYVVTIKGIDNAGKLDATYFNPTLPTLLPFAKADATMNGGIPSVFLGLRAGGYAGSTYTLTYDPNRDQLIGVYFQAVAQQKFNVFFVRRK